MSVGSSAFQLAYQVSPIILVGGVAQSIPFGMLPIIAVTEAANFVLGILNGQVSPSLDDFFAQFQVLPGGTLINNQFGKYPFANQTVASNAVIAEPLALSMLMICPVRQDGGWTAKLATMSALKATLDAHNQSGGTYTVATPSYIYTGLLMSGFRDVSNSASKQMQWLWQIDFEKPLVSQADAGAALNSLMNKLSAGLPAGTDPVSWAGQATNVGSTATTGAGSLLPSAQGLTGAGTTIDAGTPLGQVYG